MRVRSSLVKACIVVFAVTACADPETEGESDSTTGDGDGDATGDGDGDATGDGDGDATGDGDGDGLPAGYEQFYNLIEPPYLDGDFIVIHTNDLPDHGSPFYPEGDPLYEAYNGDNPNFSTVIMGMDPDLAEQDITLRLPVAPAEAGNHQATMGGPIGVTLNGIVIYNQYNGMGALLDDVELNNLDQYYGHPTPMNQQYHHHLEPVWLTAASGRDALVGFLRDGFPVYGPEENGQALTNADLDDYHGHEGPTAEYPEGIYHYHCTDEAPWINGDGYWGTAGAISN
jgi:hypothetical protein